VVAADSIRECRITARPRVVVRSVVLSRTALELSMAALACAARQRPPHAVQTAIPVQGHLAANQTMVLVVAADSIRECRITARPRVVVRSVVPSRSAMEFLRAALACAAGQRPPHAVQTATPVQHQLAAGETTLLVVATDSIRECRSTPWAVAI